MTFQFDLPDAFELFRIDDCKRTAAVTQINQPGCCVVANVVRIIKRTDGTNEFVSRTIKDFQRSIIAVGDGYLVCIRQIEHAGRFAESSDALEMLACGNVHDLECVVSKRGDEEAFSFCVHGHVIESSGDSRQRNCLCELESRSLLCLDSDGHCSEQSQHDRFHSSRNN